MNKYYNKEKTAIYNKRYREENKQKLSEDKKCAYQLHRYNREKNAKQVTCICGKFLNFGSLLRHKKSPFHEKMMQSFELYFV